MRRGIFALLLCLLLSLTALAADLPTLTVVGASAQAGETATVQLALSNNTGFAGARFAVSYDAALTLQDVSAGSALGSLSFTKPGDLTANPVYLLWDGLDADASNGVIAELTFEIDAATSAEYFPVTVTYRASEVYDGNLENVAVTVVNGSICAASDPLAHTHSYTEQVTTAPTCTAQGVKTFSCLCGDSYTAPIDALGHDYIPAVTAPTPEAGGYTTYTCSRCHDSYTADETAPLQLTAIAVSAQPDKTRYTAGEVFDPTGMAITASYEGGVTVPVSDYTYTGGVLAAGTTEVAVSYGGKTATVPITVLEASAAAQQTISVTFSLLGDEKHGAGAVHTLKSGGLQTWVAPMQVTLSAGATVIELVTTALGLKGIAFQKDAGGNYISGVRGVGEFDNGGLSGWMYTLNGRHGLLGVAEQTLQSGDVVVLHYTDDYTQEEGSEAFGAPAAQKSETKSEAQKSEETTPEAAQTAAVTYVDVAEGTWYGDAVAYVTEKGLMNGTGDGLFSPAATMTRAMLMTVLARYAGAETSGGATWYEKAMVWATENGVSDGTNPNGEITREQLCTMLYRYAGSPAAAGELPFSDASDVSEWALAAMRWASANGIVNGMTETTLAPKATATRAQVATILMRFTELGN